MNRVLLIFFLFFSIVIVAQESKKTIRTSSISNPPKIDGILDDEAWQGADIASDFLMFEPGDGDPEPNDRKTQVKIVYDNEAIYIGAYMFDSDPDKISRQLTDRDNFGNADAFGLALNPNNDGQNEFMFLITAAGVQLDAQVSPLNGDDYSWNEVWYSSVSFDENGWYAEIKLPYSAIRFSSDNLSIWGINIFRSIDRENKIYSWNYIDKSKGNSSQYTGNLTGLENIKPPIRLGLAPFVSSILDNYDGVTDIDYAFGLDVKYGISDNFTLMATLVPDFSQVGFDNIVLNLGPFEQKFAEQRQFFIEGADLLEKGDLFFSRRIGNRPVGHAAVEEFVEENSEFEIVDNPTEVDVINIIKVTGRTKKGLGIAVLNAITKKTEATVRDTITGEKHKIVTEPLANYNVLVIDQEFNKNSSVGIVNTNVIRKGLYRDANVTSLVFNLANKANSYRLEGDGSTSTVQEDGISTTGFASNLEFGKTKGKIRYEFGHNFADDKYDKNDLGFQRRNNYNSFDGSVSYRIFKPTKHFNSLNISFWAGYFRRYDPSVYTGNYFNLRASATNLKQMSYGFRIGANIGLKRDYFEPRTEGRYWVVNPETNISGWFSSDNRKKFAFSLSIGTGWYNGNDEGDYYWSFSPRYRVNDKLQFSYSIGFERDFNELGYVTTLEDETIIFGKRQTKEVENSMVTQYNINDKSSISLVFRHYWSPVIYEDQYFKLEDNGELTDNDYTGDNDLNFNSWNLDLRYIWRFTRGSELVFLYRNSILNEDSFSDLTFQDNISNLFDQPFGQSISLKVVYYIDYIRVRSWFN